VVIIRAAADSGATRTGHSYVVTVLAENPSQPINQATAIPVILSAVKEAFTLAAHR
jgi:hypothetical protein